MTTLNNAGGGGASAEGKDKTADAGEQTPEIHDDGAGLAEGQDRGAQPAPGPREPAPAREDHEPPALVRDTIRDGIAARRREVRDAEIAAARDADEGADSDETPPAEASKDGETTPPAEISTGEETPAQRKIRLKVDGAEVEKTEEEIIALAQKQIAGDNRLDTAKEALREVNDLKTKLGELFAAQVRQPENPPAGSPSPAPAAAPAAGSEHQPARPQVDAKALEKIAERIQAGDLESGTQALTELVGLMMPAASRDAGISEDRARQIAQESMVIRSHDDELGEARDRFAREYAHIAKDELLSDAARTVMRGALIEDLKKAGISETDIAPIKDNIRQLTVAHRGLRNNGVKGLATFDAMLTQVGQTIETRFNLKKPAAPAPTAGNKGQGQQQSPRTETPRVTLSPEQVQAREAAKRAAPQQPRSAGARLPNSSKEVPKTRSEIVQSMQSSRKGPQRA